MTTVGIRTFISYKDEKLFKIRNNVTKKTKITDNADAYR